MSNIIIVFLYLFHQVLLKQCEIADISKLITPCENNKRNSMFFKYKMLVNIKKLSNKY